MRMWEGWDSRRAKLSMHSKGFGNGKGNEPRIALRGTAILLADSPRCPLPASPGATSRPVSREEGRGEEEEEAGTRERGRGAAEEGEA